MERQKDREKEKGRVRIGWERNEKIPTRITPYLSLLSLCAGNNGVFTSTNYYHASKCSLSMVFKCASLHENSFVCSSVSLSIGL